MSKQKGSRIGGTNKTLYRKYRSRQLSDVIGQEHITDTLANSIEAGRVSHAYLFSGPRGVGKTSVARILAHLVNNLDYSDDNQYLDIIEIDAASNRGIDDIRDLREKVHIAPIQAPYKVYIIDEVHMLTTHSFNALLKTLEEPPEHVIFILATTEPHKLPDTITSRTQHYKFKPVDSQQVSDLLESIAKDENIEHDHETLGLIAKYGQGSVRDSISMFDQIASSGQKITIQLVESTLGLISQHLIDETIDLIETSDLKTVSQKLDKITSQGVDSRVFANQLYQSLKNKLVSNTADTSKNLADIKLMRDLLDASKTYDSQLYIESALFRYVLSTNTPVASISSDTEKKQQTDIKQVSPEAPKSDQIVNELKKETKPETESIKDNTLSRPTTQTAQTIPSELDSNKWSQIIEHIKATNNTLAGLLNQTRAVLENDTLQILCPYSFHVKRLQTSTYQTKLNEAAQQFISKSITLDIIHQQNDNSSTTRADEEVVVIEEPAHLGKLEAIKNIMGGGEVINV